MKFRSRKNSPSLLHRTKSPFSDKISRLLAWARRFMERTQRNGEAHLRKARVNRQRRVRISPESLEPRVMLTNLAYTVDIASPDYVLSGGLLDGKVDLKLQVGDNGAGAAELQLIDIDRGNLVVGTAPFTESINVDITGYHTEISGKTVTFPENLLIDLSNHTSYTPAAENISVSFDGFKDVNPLTKHTISIAQPNGIGNGMYSPSGLNVSLVNGDLISVIGALPASGDVSLSSEGVIDVTGTISTSGDVTLNAIKTITTDGTADSLDPLNLPSTSIAIHGGTVSGKNVTLTAHSTTNVTISTATELDGQLSIGEVIVSSEASVLVEGAAHISSTQKLAMNATSDVTTVVTRGTDTNSGSGDKKTQDAAISASVVITHANVTIKDTATVTAGDTATIAALNNVNATTVADGQQGNSSAGGVVAVSTVESQTNVEVDDNASLLAANALTLSATTNRTVTTTAIATSSGATDDGDPNTRTTGQKKLADPDGNPNTNDKAATSDGDMKLAAVVAVHTLTGSTQANIKGGTLTSTGGSINVLSNMTNTVTTTADGTPSTGGNNTGVGVAVGVGATDISNKANIAGNVTLHANTVNLKATTNPSTIKVEAKSGKSGDAQGADTNVAGALAVNVAVIRTEAVVATGAIVDAQGSNLVLASQSTTSTIANAIPVEDAIGKSLGIGASVAVNVNDMTTRSVMETGTTVTNAKGLSLSSVSDNGMDTHAKSGAKGGTAIAASVGIAIAHHDTIARVEADNPGLVATGDVSLSATHTGHVITLSEGDAKGVTAEPGKDQNGQQMSDAQGQAAIGAAVSMNYVVDQTLAELNRSISTSGAITLAAVQAAASQSTAKASAKGDKDKGQGNVDNQANNQRGAGNSAATSRGARDSSGAPANPSASTSEGGVSVAAGIAINIANTTSRAAIGNNDIVQSGKAMSVTSAANTDASAIADGNAIGGKDAAVGAAVGINLANVNNVATIGTGTHVTADGLTLSATMRNVGGDTAHTLSAKSVSGAGGSGVGIAGSFAMSIDNVDTHANIQGNTTVSLADGGDPGTGVGLTKIESVSNTNSLVSATAAESGQNSSDLGIGASVALNIVNQKSHAAIEDSAVVDGAQDLTITANSDHNVTTEAKGGASGGSVTLTPVVALSFVFDKTDARIGQQNGSLDVDGLMTVTAQHTGHLKADATGSASGASDAAIGASLALSDVHETTTATTTRSLSSGGAMSFTAISSSANETNALASASGAKGNSENGNGNGGSGPTVQGQVDNQRGMGNSQSTANGGESSGTDNKATAKTADKDGDSNGGAVTVAAAVAVSIVDSNATAEIKDGLTITSGGLLNVHSSQNVDAKANASGAATQGDDGIAAAVAINVVDVGNHARIGASTVTADGLTVDAVMTAVPGEQVSTDTFRADALSGAAGKDVGIAGSLAINHAAVKTTATIDGGASIILADGTDAGTGIGPVTINAVAVTSNTANALPVHLPPNGDTPSDGIGVSVALNLVYDDTTATIEDGASWSGGSASSLTVTATANHTMATEAKNGGKAKDVGVGGAVAVVIAKNNTTAYVGTGTGAIQTTGAATIKADHTSTTNTKVSSAATGSDAAIGASVGINLVTENVKGELARDLTTGGSVVVKSQVEVTGTVEVKASAAGGDSDGDDADSESSKQANQPNATTDGANTTPKSKDNANSANNQSKSESESSGGGVGIAASVGVNALSVHNTAQISHGADVTATGSVAVSAPAHIVARATSDSTAVDLNGNVSIGAAVSINVASLTNKAIVGTGSSVSGNGITVEAVTTAIKTNDYTATAFAVAGNEGDVSVSGVVAINVVDANTTAMTADGSTLNSSGDINITANHHSRVQAAAIAGAFSSGAAVAPALALNLVGEGDGGSQTIASLGDSQTNGVGAIATATGDVNVTADYFVGMFPILDLPDTLNNPPPDYSDYAIQDMNIEVASVAISGGGSSGSLAFAGSVGINLLSSTTHAVIDQQAAVDAGSVSVHAGDTSNINSLAGSIGISTDGAGIGAGLDLGIVHKDTQALIGKGAQVTSADGVHVIANSIENVVSVAANAGVGDSAGIAGSAAVQVIDTKTKALIENGTSANDAAVVDAQGSVELAAGDTFNAKMVAGAVGAGGSAGVGASNTTLVHTGDVEARVGDWANVTAGDNGLSVIATSHQELLTIAAAGGAAGTASVAGSAAVNVLDETTIASIGRNATIHTIDPSPLNSPDVKVSASDTTLAVSVAGSLAASGGVGAGIGADVAKINKNTAAFIDSNVTANVKGDVIVTATSSERFTSVAAGLAAASNVAISLDASVHVLDVKTRAFIGDDPSDKIPSAGAGDVHAQGSIVISSDDQMEADKIVGVLAVSGTAAVAAGAAVTVTNKTTEAFIGKGAKVTADGNTTGLNVRTGRYVTSYVAPANSATPGIESNSSLTVNASASDLSVSGQVGLPSTGSTDTNGDGKDDAAAPGLSGQRTLTPELKSNFHGISVTAMNRDDIADYSLSLAGGQVGIAISAGVNVLNNHTIAYIGQDATLNENTAQANNAQSINVAAGSDFGHVAFAGSVAGGFVGVGPAASVTVLNNTTEAYLGWDAKSKFTAPAVANAKNDVIVVARATEDVLLVGVGIGGGAVGIGAGVDVLSITNQTSAAIGQNAAVLAGGDVVVQAIDDTAITIISGGGGGGFVGLGGAVGVMTLTKETNAWIDTGAVVDARGAGAGISGVDNGDLNANSDAFVTTTAHGVIVQANSSEDIFHMSLAVGVGYVGVSGGVTVSLIDSNTSAEIKDNASINQTDNFLANGNQSVYVNAANHANIVTFAGALAGGAGAVSGGVDYGTLKNDTLAGIGKGASISAKHDVEVNALGIKKLNGIAFSGAGGGVGIAGTVSVWSIGTPLEKSYSDNNGNSATAGQADQKDGGKSADEDAAGQADAGKGAVASQLNGFEAPANANPKGNSSRVDGITGNASSLLISNAPSQSAINDAINSGAASNGTSAFIGSDTTVTAGGDISVKANEHVDVDITLGGVSVGAASVGAAIGVLSIAANTSALSAGTLTAGGDVEVKSLLQENVDGIAIAGAMGGAFGVGAAVYEMHDSSVVQSAIGSVVSAGSVIVLSDATQDLNLTTAQAATGGAAVGASFTRVTADGSVTSTVLGGAQIGQKAGQTVGSLDVKSNSIIDIHNKTGAVAAGGVAVSANFAFATVSPKVTTTLENGVNITVTGDASVEAIADQNVLTEVLTLTGGVGSLGASISQATLDAAVEVEVAGGVTLKAGAITLEARNNHDGTLPTGKNAKAVADAPSVSLAGAGAGTFATAKAMTDVSTHIGPDAKFTSTTGDVSIRSLNSDQAEADALALSLSLGAAIGASEANANASGNTTTTIEGSVTSKTSLTIGAIAENVAHAKAETGTAGIGAGAGATATATASPTVQTEVAGLGILNAASTDLEATSSNQAIAQSDGTVIGGLVGVGVIGSTAHANGITKARLGEETHGGGVTIHSDSKNTAHATSVAASGGIGGAGNAVTATVDMKPEISAVINNKVSVTGPVAVLADSHTDAQAIAHSVTLAAGSGGNSVATVISAPKVSALVQGGGISSPASQLKIAAHDTSNVLTDAGSAAGGVMTAVGTGVAHNTVKGTVLAGIETGSDEAGSISISAIESATINAKAVGIAISGGISSAGGEAVNDIANKVKAHIYNDVDVTAHGNVSINAQDGSTILANVDQTSGGLVGGGTAETINHIANQVEASVEHLAQITTPGNVQVIATEDATIRETSVGASGGFIGASGNVAINTLANNVSAFIDDKSNVQADNNVVVQADLDNSLTANAANTSVGAVGIGGTIAINTFDNTTRAFINESTVVAKGNGPDTQIARWNPVTGVASTQNLSGLAVIASTVEHPAPVIDPQDTMPAATVRAFNVSGGLAGLSGIATVDLINDHTDAFISSSLINSFNNVGGDVIVRAHSDQSISVFSGGAAAGFAGVGGNIDRTEITSETRAFISDNKEDGKDLTSMASTVFGANIDVDAVSRETIAATMRGASAGGLALAGTVSIETINANNQAFIKDSSVASIGGLSVRANDSTAIDPVDPNNPSVVPGVTSESFGGIAGGAAISLNTIRNTVQARVLGSSVGAKGVMSIVATSAESINVTAKSEAAGAVSLSGAVSINTIETTTEAIVESTATSKSAINQAALPPGGFPNSSLTIAAEDTAGIKSKLGNVAAGLAGVGASVDMGAIRNRTVTKVGQGVQITTDHDVTIKAHSDHTLDSHVYAGSLGAVGLSGAVSFLSLGAPPSAEAQAEFTKPSQDDPNVTLLGQMNSSVKKQDLSKGIGNNSLATAASDKADGLSDPSADGALDVNIDVTDKVTAAFIEDAVNSGAKAKITAGGSISITASNEYSVTQSTGADVGGLVGIGAGISVTNINNTTVASLGDFDVLNALGDVTIHATDTAKIPVEVTAYSGAAGIIDVQFNVAEVTLTTTTTARVGNSAEIPRAADVDVNAVQSASISTIANGYAVAALGGAGADKATPTVTTTTTATIVDSAKIGNASDIGSLSVSASATNDVTATTSVGSVSLGPVASGGGAIVTVNSTVLAHLGDVDVDSIGGVAVTADASNTATSTMGSFGGGVVAEGASIARSTITGSVIAEVSPGAKITTTGPGASGFVFVHSNSTNMANATATATNVGLIGGSAAESLAKIDVDSLAQIGTANDGATIEATGAIRIESNSTNKANSDSEGTTVAIAGAGGLSKSEAIVEGSTRSFGTGQLTSTNDFIRVQALDTNSHAVATATAAGGGLLGSVQGAVATASIAPSANDNQAQVRARLAGTIEAHGDIAVRAKSVGAFSTATGNGVSIAGLYSGGSTNTTSTLAQTLRSSIGDGSSVTSDGDVKVEATNSAGFSTSYASNSGGALIDETGSVAIANAISDVAAVVGSAVITAKSGTLHVNASSKNLASATANGIGIGLLAGLGNASATTTVAGAASNNPSTEAAIADGASFDLGALDVSSLEQDRGNSIVTGTGGGFITAQSTNANVNITPNVVAAVGANVTGSTSGNAQIISESQAEGDAVASANSYGAAAIGATAAHVSVTPIVKSTLGQDSHFTVGNDMTISAKSGLSYLPTDPMADGTSSAVANGSSAGAFVGNIGGDASVNFNADVEATINDRTNGGKTIDATHDLNITTQSEISAITSSTNTGIGIFAEAGAVSVAGDDIDNISRVSVGNGVQLSAGHDLTISSESKHAGNAHSKALAIGALGSVTANNYVDIDYQTIATIGHHAVLTAGTNLSTTTSSSSTGSTNTDADAGGLGASTSANTRKNNGDNYNNNGGQLKVGGSQAGVRVGQDGGANSKVEIFDDATLTADILTLNAGVDKTSGQSLSTSSGGGAIGDANGLSRVELEDQAIVVIHANSTLTGNHQVNLISKINSVSVTTNSQSQFTGGGPAYAYAIGDINTNSSIITEDDSFITTHALKVQALVDSTSVTSVANKSSAGGDEQHIGLFDPDRTISFDSDVVLTSGNATLIIGPDGSVIQQENVTFTTTPTDIIVQPIVNDHPGTALFETNHVPNVTINGVVKHAPEGIVESDATQNGQTPSLITFRETLDQVHIENQSQKGLIIKGITVVNSNVKPQIVINTDADQLIVQQQPILDYIGYDLAQSFLPTPITILETTSFNADIVITGTIDNPIGTTQIVNNGGGIQEGNGATIRTDVLEIDAKTDVGSAVTPLKVDLVASSGKPIGQTTTAGGDVWMNVRGLNRDKLSPNLVFDVGSVTGQNVDVHLEPSVKQTTLGNGFTANVDTFEKVQNKHTVRKFHFRNEQAGNLNLPLGIFGIGNTQAQATYLFDLVQAEGGNIHLTTPDSGTKVNIAAYTNVVGDGFIDAFSNSNLTLIETAGDLQIGLVGAPDGAVGVASVDGNIVDQLDDVKTDIYARSIVLVANSGAIGSKANHIEIDSSFHASGLVTANALNGIYLTEQSGDLNVGKIISKTGDVCLVTNRGSIVDGNNDSDVDIQGVNITLIANLGDIGEQNDYLEVDSSNPTPGKLTAITTGGPDNNNNIWIKDLGGVNVQLVQANGSVSIATPNGGDLVVSDHGLVVAKKKIDLKIGGNITIMPGSSIQSDSAISIRGDWMNGVIGQDTIVHLDGTLSAPLIDILGGDDGNQFVLNGLFIGATTVKGGKGKDQFVVNPNFPSNELVPVGNQLEAGVSNPSSLTLDGRDGSDDYQIQFGRLRVPVAIADTGVNGIDSATVNGTPARDFFSLTNNLPNGTAQTGSSVRTGGLGLTEGSGETQLFGQVLNYSKSLETLTVRGQGGSDFFRVQPSQTTKLTIDGGPLVAGDLDILQLDAPGLPVRQVGSSLQVSGGRPRAFLSIEVLNIDITPPTAKVEPLPLISQSRTIPLNVTLSDPTSMSDQPVSGVATYDLYVSVDSGPWKSFATDVPATQTKVNFTAESNHSYAFRAVARDFAGNMETEGTIPVAEARTRTFDIDPPESRVTSVTPDASHGTFSIAWSAADAGVLGLREVKVYVAVDDQAPTEIGRTLIPSTFLSPTKSTVGTLTYAGIRDGREHSYRFLTIGTDVTGNVEVKTDPTSDIVVRQTFGRTIDGNLG